MLLRDYALPVSSTTLSNEHHLYKPWLTGTYVIIMCGDVSQLFTHGTTCVLDIHPNYMYVIGYFGPS